MEEATAALVAAAVSARPVDVGGGRAWWLHCDRPAGRRVPGRGRLGSERSMKEAESCYSTSEADAGSLYRGCGNKLRYRTCDSIWSVGWGVMAVPGVCWFSHVLGGESASRYYEAFRLFVVVAAPIPRAFTRTFSKKTSTITFPRAFARTFSQKTFTTTSDRIPNLSPCPIFRAWLLINPNRRRFSSALNP